MRVKPRFHAASAILWLFLVLIPSFSFAQCSDPEQPSPNGLRSGQSVAIRPFRLLDPSDYSYNERDWLKEEMRKLQDTFATHLADEFRNLGVFGEIRKGSSDAAPTDLVLDGSLTRISDTPGGISVTISAHLLRSSDGAEVLRIARCATTVETNVNSSFLRRVPGMLDSFLANIAPDLARTIAKAAGPSASPPQGQAAAVPRAEGPVDVPVVMQRLRSEDPTVQSLAFKALVAKGGAAVEPLINALSDESICGLAIQALREIKDPRAVQPLTNVLRNPRHGRSAAEALGEIGDPRAIEPLIAVLGDENVAYGAMIALGQLKASAAVPPLLAMLTPGLNESVKSQLIKTLGEIGDARAAEPLLAQMRRSSDIWRQTILGALGGIPDTRAVAALVEALKSKDERFQRAATLAFRQVRPGYGCDPLIALLHHPDQRVRTNALAAFEGMSNQTLGADESKWRAWCEDKKRTAGPG